MRLLATVGRIIHPSVSLCSTPPLVGRQGFANTPIRGYMLK